MPVRMSEDAASTNQYRQLNPVAVRATIDRLAERIRARFPHRNLPLIAAELSRTIDDVTERTNRHRTRLRWVRWVCNTGIAVLIVVTVFAFVMLIVDANRAQLPARGFDWLPVIESGINDLVFAAIGIFFLWAASDWPIGTLGASYLSSIHMMQFMLYTLAAAPMLMLGTPEWMGRRIIEGLHLSGLNRILTRPLVAAIVSNVILIGTHSPIAVDTLRATQFGSFALDMIWLVSGFILWGPIISPMPECRARTAPIKLIYLFAAAALMPMIPGGFLTFASQPLYSTYELAPRLDNIGALNDQQVAGVLMKVGNLPVIWTVMAVIWFRWYKGDVSQKGRTILRDPVTGAPLRRPQPTTASR